MPYKRVEFLKNKNYHWYEPGPLNKHREYWFQEDNSDSVKNHQTPENTNLWGLRKIIRFGKVWKGGKHSFHICMQSAGHQKIIYFLLSTWGEACEIHIRFCLYCKPFHLCQVLKREIIETELCRFSKI